MGKLSLESFPENNHVVVYSCWSSWRSCLSRGPGKARSRTWTPNSSSNNIRLSEIQSCITFPDSSLTGACPGDWRLPPETTVPIGVARRQQCWGSPLAPGKLKIGSVKAERPGNEPYQRCPLVFAIKQGPCINRFPSNSNCTIAVIHSTSSQKEVESSSS